MTDKINHYQNQFRKGLLPRRDFMKLAAVAGISTTALGNLMSTDVFAATPKRGGRLIVGVEATSTTNSLDPAAYFSTADHLRGSAVYDTLVNRGPDMQPVPRLATSWEALDGAARWVFKLRKGVVFHDGKSLDAEDVIYSFHHHIREKSESPGKAYFDQIKQMRALDKHTVEFTLASPNADFAMTMSNGRGAIISKGYKDFTFMTNGTGPFKVKKYKAGVSYIFERNPNYWGPGGPYVDEIEYIGVGDSTARVNALLSGDIDLMIYLDPKAVPLIKRNKTTTLIQSKSALCTSLAMMLDRAPTRDNNVRLAMKYAIDRNKLLKNVFKDLGQVGNDHPIPSFDPYYNHDIPQREYDPEKARFYIKKAGFENKPIDLYTSEITGAGSIALCEIYQETARTAGVKLNVIKTPADSYWGNIWMKKPFCTSHWDPFPVPDLVFSLAYKGGVPYNETAWNNAKFDKLLLEARGEIDFAKRKEMYGEMQRLLQDEGGCIYPVFQDFIDASSSKVKGITPHPSGPLGQYQFATNVWLDS
jgi:peptide/nickel transport system substrate-binding protein